MIVGLLNLIKKLDNIKMVIENTCPEMIYRTDSWRYHEDFQFNVNRLIALQLATCDRLTSACQRIVLIFEEYKDDYDTDNEYDIMNVRQ